MLGKKILFIADFFLDEVHGGSEKFSDELINLLRKDGYEVLTSKSSAITPSILKDKQDHFVLVSNHKQLSLPSKKHLITTLQGNSGYAVVEHDADFCATNNPAQFPKFIIPENLIINKEFYAHARMVFTQSKLHAEVFTKNTRIPTVSLGMNLWSDEDLSLLEKLIGTPKTRKTGIIDSINKNKGTPYAVAYCRKNNIEFDFIKQATQEKFYEELSKTENLVFFPQWLESFSRLAVEARVLGVKLTTNKAVGSMSEPFAKLSCLPLLNEIKRAQKETYQKIKSIVDKNLDASTRGSIILYPEITFPKKLPKVSVITSLFKGEKFIEGYLATLKAQTIFQDIEVMLVNANSPENEEKYILPFIKEYPNVKYKKLTETPSVMKTMNDAIKECSGDFIAQLCVDDRYAPDALEVMSKHLSLDSAVDWVYADVIQSNKPNETTTKNTSYGKLYEHSLFPFSRENCIKCLWGCMPMIRKDFFNKVGYFKDEMKFSGDWELMLRGVSQGSIGKKIDKVCGLYFMNENGLSTSKEYAIERLKEESQVFNKYKDIFGTENYEKYKNYFYKE